MNMREEFAKWWKDNQPVATYNEVWQAAWKARGEHDLEICNMYANMYCEEKSAKECANTIRNDKE